MTKRPRALTTIGLMGPFGYGNLGDAATQDAILQYLRERFPEAELRGFSLNPGDTEARHSIKAYSITRSSAPPPPNGRSSMSASLAGWLRGHRNPRVRKLERWALRIPKEFGLMKSAFRNLEGVDLLVISGGGQLEDYWGDGPWTYPYTLLKWSVIARLRGARLVFISVGAGPLRADLSKLFIRGALALADYRSFRDKFSKRLIQNAGFKHEDPVYPDLAHSLRLPDELFAPRRRGPYPTVGIGPVGYFKPGLWPESDPARYQAYLDKLARFIKWLVGKGYAVSLLPGEAHYDQIAINDLYACVSNADFSAKVRRPSIASVYDLLTELAGVDFVVSCRFHGVLLAQLLSKPSIALSYQEKMDALMEDAELSEYCLPIAGFSLEQLTARFEALEVNQEAIRDRLLLHSRGYRKALEEQYSKIFERYGSAQPRAT